jgi:DHA2 family metal-tetracycline-proton antiporter-like MFS transporter
VNPAEPAPADGHVPERITVPLCVIIFFSVLNGMMFNVAIPDIAMEFHLLPSEASWIMTGYILLFGLGSLVYGRLADSRSVRGLITLGLLLLNAGSLLGYFSRWYPMVIAARLVQASGGAAIPALAMLVATKYMPSDIRGKVLGVIAATVSLAAGVGPVLGGFIAEALGWRALFLVTLLTILTIPSLRDMLPGDRKSGEPFDFAGLALLGSGVSCLLFGFTTAFWWLILPGVLGVVLFVVHVARSSHPLVPVEILRSRPFRNTAAVTFLAMGSLFGMVFATPLMLSGVNGLGVGAIGLTLFPGAMSAALLGRAGGRLNDRKGSVFVATAGMAMTITGFLLLSTVSGRPPVAVAAVIIVSYVGWAFLQSSLPHRASTTLPPRLAGVGMGFYNLIFFMSGAFSASIIGRILDVKPGGFCLNPLASCVPGWPYSNVFMGLAAVTAAALVLYRVTFAPGRLEDGAVREG